MAQMREYHNPFLTANFIDNHDVERFLAAGTVDGFRLAYTLMVTIPGIPVIYQGDEQLFTEYRQAMFNGGYQSDKNYFDQKSEMYIFIKKLSEIRKSHKLFSRGSLEVLKDNPVRSGIFAYKREYKDKVGYVILNNSKNPTLLNRLPTDFSSNMSAPTILMSKNYTENLNFDKQGVLTQVIPANSILIFTGDKNRKKIKRNTSNDGIYFDSIETAYIDKKTAYIKGHVTEGGAKLLRIIDGDYSNALPITADNSGQWEFKLSVNDLGEKKHFVEIYWPAKKIASEQKKYLVKTTKAEYSVKKEDAKNDHKGVAGNYTLPTHESIGCEMDIENVNVRAGGNILELTLNMCEVSDVWQPPNQFDHVSFTIFFNVDQSTGMNDLPVIKGKFPKQGRWDLAHVSYGWGNYVYSTDKASLKSEGTKLGVAPKIEVNKKYKSIRFIYNGAEFGVDDWKNTQVYITTWDKDGGGSYRNLSSKPNVWDFGGGDKYAEKILDDMLIEVN